MRYLLVLLSLLSLMPLLAQAQVSGLYQAEVAVADQAADTRAEGMQRALMQVLIKVSGTTRVVEDGALHGALQRASRYAQRYQYRSDGVAEEPRLLMAVEFESNAVDGLLAEYGYPVWGRVRPQTLVWLAVEDRGQRSLVGADDSGLAREVIMRSAAERALPVQLPLLDLSDRQRVQVADIWGGFWDDIVQASQRYQAQAILIGRLAPLGSGQWEVRWTLLDGDESEHWQQRSGDVDALIGSGVRHSSEWLSSRYARAAGGSDGELLMRVDGVGNLYDYRRVVEHLSGLSGVQSLRLVRIDSEGMQLALGIDGGQEVLQRTIALGRLLVAADQDPPQQMHYRLRQ